MPADPVDSVICDKAVTEMAVSAARTILKDDMLSRPTADSAMFVPAYTDTAPVALRDMYPALATDRPVDPANTLIDPPVLNAKYSLADSEIDEACIDMVLAADNVRMLPEYNPRYDDEVSDKDVDEDSVSAGLSMMMLDDLIDSAYADEKDAILKLYR